MNKARMTAFPFDLVAIARQDDIAKDARSFADYEVKINREHKPQDIELIEIL